MELSDDARLSVLRAICYTSAGSGTFLYVPCKRANDAIFVQRYLTELGERKPACGHAVFPSEKDRAEATGLLFSLPITSEVRDPCVDHRAWSTYHLVICDGLLDMCGEEAVLRFSNHAARWLAFDDASLRQDGESEKFDYLLSALTARGFMLWTSVGPGWMMFMKKAADESVSW